MRNYFYEVHIAGSEKEKSLCSGSETPYFEIAASDLSKGIVVSKEVRHVDLA